VTEYTPPDSPLELIHVDADLILAMKPAGLLSVPGKGAHLADCLIARIAEVHPEVLLVHRLDRDTSGVIVFARNPRAQRHLGLQFEKRQLRKVYVARVSGRVDEVEGEIDLPIGVDWPNRPRQHVDPENGRPAQTRWRVVEAGDDETRVRLMPKTGRSHQLRVHMAEMGHPILGDPLYATGAARAHPRLMLHSESLRLRHPTGGAWVTFRAEAPF
jgi:tRNA pseudouridine32 synthase/23S rRNA pseudouridine746 synthase